MSTTETTPDVGDVVAIYSRPAGYGPELVRIVDTTPTGFVTVGVSPFDFAPDAGPAPMSAAHLAAHEWEIVG